jgi:uncharacterized oligopeptide transporter (OPT) family protein
MGMASGAKSPQMLRFAAAVQAVETAGVLVAAILALADTLKGHSFTKSNGLGIAALTFVTAILMALIAKGIAQTQPWSRTPAVLTQVIVGIVAIVLMQGGRYDWGVPGIVLAVAGLAGLLNPASFRALIRD